MTAWHGMAGNWIVYSLGWTLLHFCWQGAVVAATLWSALELLEGRSSRTRYAVSCAALALLVVLPAATFGHIALEQYHRTVAGRAAVIRTVPGLVVLAGARDSGWLTRLVAMLDPAIPWLLVAWMLGSALFLFRLSVGIGVTRKLRRLAVSPVAVELQTTLDSLRQRLEVARPVKLMHSALVQAPTVIGWLRPVVLIPASCFLGLPSAQIEAILCHELAHIRRHDYLVSVVQAVVEALLFYHPAVWWISGQVRHERECCCDDIAVTVGGDALVYAKALAALAQRSLYPQVTLGANGGILAMRIRRLLIAERTSSASQVAAAAVLALLVVSAVAVGTTARAEAGASVEAPPAKISEVIAPLIAAETPSEKSARIVAAPRAADPVQPAPPEAQRDQSTRVKVAGGVLAGAIVSKTQPKYPAVARAAHIDGAVALHAVISKTGDVVNLQVIDGPEMLRASALDAVRQWKYKPYLLNGEPVEVETTITVNYHLEADDAAPLAFSGAPDALPVPSPAQHFADAPVLVSSAPPQYTADAKANKISGAVVVSLVIDEQGLPTQVKVVRGLGYGLDEQAVAAVRAYRFKPATKDGKPISASLNIEVNFQIF